MATGDKLVTLDGLKAAYDAGVHADDYTKDRMSVLGMFTESLVIQGNGTTKSDANNKCTAFIPVKKGDKIKFKLRASTPIAVYQSKSNTTGAVLYTVPRPSGTWMEDEHTFFSQQTDGVDQYPDGTVGYFRACTLASVISDAYAYLDGPLPDVIRLAIAEAQTGTAADVTALAGRVTSAETNVTNLTSRVAEAESDITALDAKVPSVHLSGKNKYGQVTTVPGRLTSATQVSSNATNMTTDYFDVTGFTKSVCVSPRVRAWAEYLSDKSVNTEADEAGYHNYSSGVKNAVLTPHENTAFIRVTLYQADEGSIQFEDGDKCTFYESPDAVALDETITLNDAQRSVVAGMSASAGYSPLYAKKWAACGDSFTKGAFDRSPTEDYTIEEGMYAGSKKTYCNLIANRNLMTIQDLSYGGMTMATPASGGDGNNFSNPNASHYNYSQIAEDVDYITLYFGINDQHHISQDAGDDGESIAGAITLGEVTDTTTATFCGAYNTVLSWIKENRPYAHVGVIVTNGASNDIAQATIAIAERWGIPYINLNGDERTPAMLRSTNPDLTAEARATLFAKQAVRPVADTSVDPPIAVNSHPNAKAHEFEAHFIEQFLKTL